MSARASKKKIGLFELVKIMLMVILTVIVVFNLPFNSIAIAAVIQQTDNLGDTLTPQDLYIEDKASSADFGKTGSSLNNVEVDAATGEVKLVPNFSSNFTDSLGQFQTPPSMPQLSEISCFAHVGVSSGEDYVYALFVSGDGTVFGRINMALAIDKRQWEFLEPLPRAAGDGAALAYAQDRNCIYALRGLGSTDVFEYNLGTGVWSEFSPSVNAPVTRGSGIVYAQQKLFVITGGGNASMYIHDFANPFDAWQTKALTASGMQYYSREGSSLTYAGGSYVYLCLGGYRYYENSQYKYRSDFLNYNISSGVFENITSLTHSVSIIDRSVDGLYMYTGCPFWYPGSGNYIYARSYKRFYRFNVQTNSSTAWEKLPDIPQNPGNFETNYSGIFYFPYGDNNELNYFLGYNYTLPWKYDVGLGKWITIVAPATVIGDGNGASLCYVTSGPKKYIYYVTGSKSSYSTEFFRYDLDNNEWVKLANISASDRRTGQRLVYANGYIYFLSSNWINASGNPITFTRNFIETTFWRYDITQTPGSDSWQQLANFPAQTDHGTNITVVPGADIDASLAGKFYIYCLKAVDMYDSNGLNYCALADNSQYANLYVYEIDPNLSIAEQQQKEWSRKHPLRPAEDLYLTFSSTYFRGSKMAYSFYDKQIYAAPGNATQYFYKYDPIANTWNTSLPNITFDRFYVDGNGNLEYADLGDEGAFIYAFTGESESAYGWSSRWGRFCVRASSPSYTGTRSDANLWYEIDANKQRMPVWKWGSSGCVVPGVGAFLITRMDPSFYKYSFSNGTWSNSLKDRFGSKEGNMVVDSNNNIYVFFSETDWATLSSHVFVYSTSLKRWKAIIPAPFKISFATRAVYAAPSNTIYVLEGRNSKRMHKYRISTQQWIYNANDDFSSENYCRGGTMIGVNNPDGSVTLYAEGGEGSAVSNKELRKYQISNSGVEGQWFDVIISTTKVSVPAVDYRYLFSNVLAYSSGTFYYIDYTSDLTFTKLCVLVGSAWQYFPITLEDGSNLVADTGAMLFNYKNPTTGKEYLYFMPRNNMDKLMYFCTTDTPAGTFPTWISCSKMPTVANATSTAVVPVSVAIGTNTRQQLYFYNGKWPDYFIVYDIASDSWSSAKFLDQQVSVQSGVCGYKGYVYYLGSNGFYRYNTGINEWDSLPAPPFTINASGLSLVVAEKASDGKAYLFVTPGEARQGFYSYSISENKWLTSPDSRTPTTPSFVSDQYWRAGNSLVWKGNYIYALRGGSPEVYRYNIESKQWQTCKSIPASVGGVGWGSNLVIKDNYLYALIGSSNDFAFYYFDLSLPQNILQGSGPVDWAPRTRCPLPFFSSHSNMIYPGFGKYIYILQGASYSDNLPSNVILKYNTEIDVPTNPNSKPWSEFNAVTPLGAKFGSSLVYPGTGNYFYYLSRDKFYFDIFGIFAFGSYTSDIKPVGIHCNWGRIQWTEDTHGQSINAYVRAGNKPNLSDALDWSRVFVIKNNGKMEDVLSDRLTNQYIQYKFDFVTDDPAPNLSPSLISVKLNYKKYPLQEERFFDIKDSTFVNNRLVNLTWNQDTPKGTGLRFQLASSASGVINATDFAGPVTTEPVLYGLELASASKYEMDTNIKMEADGWARLAKSVVYSQDIDLVNNSSSILNDYQLKLTLDSSHATFWSIVQSDGKDIRFADNVKNRIPYWIESFKYDAANISNCSAVIWVKVPSVPLGSSKIYLYYGSRSATSESSFKNTMGVTDSDTSLVTSYHFDELDGATTLDASSNGYNGVVRGLTTRVDSMSGFGKALRFATSQDFVSIVAAADNPISSQAIPEFTVEAWVKIGAGDGQQLFSFKGASLPQFRLAYASWRPVPVMYLNSGTGKEYYRYGSLNIKDNQWHHIVFVLKETRDPLSASQKVYIDGIDRSYDGPDNAGNVPSIPSNWQIGPYMNGLVDEFKVYSRALPQEEVIAHFEKHNYVPVATASALSVSISGTANTESVFSGWQNRQRLVINYAGQITQDKTNQVALINFDSTNNSNFWLNYTTANNGQDLRISDGYPLAYKHRVMSFDGSGKKAQISVVLPYVPASGKLVLYLYYNNAAKTGVGADPVLDLNNFIVSKKNLSGYWAFEEATGATTAADSSGKGRDATITNATVNIPGKIGKCFNFNGTNSSVDIAAPGSTGLDIAEKSFTVVAWVKGTYVNGKHSPVCGLDTASPSTNYGLFLGTSSYNPYISFSNNDTTADMTTLTSGTWYQIVYRYDLVNPGTNKGKQDIFVNGILVQSSGTPPTSSPFYQSSGTVKIGKAFSTALSALQYFTGWIDDVYIYNRALSNNEIKDFYLTYLDPAVNLTFSVPESNTALTGYSATDPVIQPILGVYYDTANPDYKLKSFTTATNIPSKTNIRFQFSNDGWKWYYFDTGSFIWKDADWAYSEATDASYIVANQASLINSFQAAHPSGDFYFRAFLHSDDGTATPALDFVRVELQGAKTFYTNNLANAIRFSQSSATNSRYFQYKAILYSDGQNTPVLNAVTYSYVDPKVTLLSPKGASTILNANDSVLIKWSFDGLNVMSGDTGKVNLYYSYSTDGGSNYTGPITIATDVDANQGIAGYGWTVPDIFSNNVRIKVSSAQFTHILNEGADFKVFGLKLHAPNGGEIFEVGNTTDNPYIIEAKAGSEDMKLPIYVYLSTNGGAKYISQPVGEINYIDPVTKIGRLEWIISKESRDFISPNCKIKVVAQSNTAGKGDYWDESDSVFSIIPRATITLASPVQGTTVIAGNPLDITWSVDGDVNTGDIRIKYSRSLDGITWDQPVLLDPQPSITQNGNIFKASWNIPENFISYDVVPFVPSYLTIIVGEQTQRDGYNELVQDMAEGVIVNPPKIEIVEPWPSPTNQCIWVVGDKNRKISWKQYGGLLGNLKLEYSFGYNPDNPTVPVDWFTINDAINQPAAPTPPIEFVNGSYYWRDTLNGGIPASVTGESASTTIYIRLSDTHSPNTVNTMVGPITVLKERRIVIKTPTPGETLLNGEGYKVEWRFDGETAASNLVLELNDGLTGHNPNVDGIGADGWPVPGKNPPTNYVKTGFTSNDGPAVACATSMCGYTTWYIPEVQTNKAKIRIYDKFYRGTIESTSPEFTITVPTVSVAAPISTSSWYTNGTHRIQWDYQGDPGDFFVLEYRINNAGSWSAWYTIDNNAPSGKTTGNKYYDWKLPIKTPGAVLTAGKPAQVRIQAKKWGWQETPPQDAKVIGVSQQFNIIPPSITLTSPSASDTGPNAWVIGTEHPITFGISAGAISAGVVNKFVVKYSNVNYGASPKESDFLNEPILEVNSAAPEIKNGGLSCDAKWTVPGNYAATTTASVMVLIYFNDTDYITTAPSGFFAIAPPNLKITNPAAAEKIGVGTEYPITWYYVGAVQFPLKLYYSYVNDNTWSGAGTGLIAQYDTQNDLPLETVVIQQSGLAYITNWDTYHEENIPHQAWLKLEDGTGTVKFITPSFRIDKPIITVNDVSGVYSVTEKINVGWNFQGKLKGPVKIQWAKNNFAVVGDIATIDTLNANTTKSVEWAIDANAYSSATSIIVKDEGFDSTAVSTSFNIFPAPNINVIEPKDTTIARIGGTYPIRWTKDCSTTGGLCGKTSNSFKLTYNDSNGVNYEITPTTTFEDGQEWSYNWFVDPLKIINPAISATITIKDNSPWKTLPAPDYKTVVSPAFNIDVSKITIAEPKGGEYWAIGDKPLISWSTEGVISASGLTLECIAGGNTYTIATGQPAIGSFTTWPVASDIALRIPVGQESIDAIIKISDTKKYINPTDGSEISIFREIGPVHILREAKIDTLNIARPGDTSGNKLFVLEEPLEITWVPKGLSIQNVKIQYYSQSNPARKKEIISSTPNDGQFLWNVPLNSLTGNDLVLEIIGLKADGFESTVKGAMPGTFRIRGAITLVPVSTDNKILAKAKPDAAHPNITWSTKGTISKITCKYKFEGDADWTLMQDVGGRMAENIDNTGGFNWAVPDLPQDRILDKSYSQKISILVHDANDLTETKSQLDNVNIVYAYVVWKIFDSYTGSELSDVDVEEKELYEDSSTSPGSSTTLSSGFYRYYPYGKYLDAFSKNDYIPYTASWTCDKASMIPMQIQLDNKILSQTQWSVKVTPNYTVSYDPETKVYADNLNISTWLEKKGKLIGLLDEERLSFHGAAIEIYKDEELIKTITSDADVPQSSGIFTFNWANPQLTKGSSYFIQAKVKYEEYSKTYEHVSGASFDVNQEIGSAIGYAEQLKAIQETTASTQSLVLSKTGDIQQSISSAKSDIQQSISSAQSTIQQTVTTEASRILTATEQTVIPAIQSTKQEVTTIKKSEILNRENAVRTGQTLTIRYRTYPGVSPSIQVYDPTNVMLLSKPMISVSQAQDTAIYEYAILFDNAWGRGDFTVVCSESNYGSMDALIISVLSTDMEQIGGAVSSVQGVVSSLSNLKDVAESLNSQFSVIESALNKVGKDLVKDVKDAAASTQALESIYGQLNKISLQVKNMYGKTAYNIDKLFTVSQEKKSDMTYLKNKTQQLKATMEINKKMIDNMANKPITQTWFEYR